MKSINTILKERKVYSTWRGSEKTAENMRQQIRERFGEKAAKEYDPKIHVLTLRQWAAFNVRIRKGESALRTYTIIEDEKDVTGKTFRKSLPVFHYLQTDLVPESKMTA